MDTITSKMGYNNFNDGYNNFKDAIAITSMIG